jgi:hypothetical protein
MDEDISEDDDPAEAFDRLRAVIEGQDRELALLRRAVEGLAAERAHIDVPDYTETLGALQQGMDAATGRINAIGQILAKAPALVITPENMAQRIVAAGSAARREDQAALVAARKELEEMTRQLHGVVVSARRGDEQNRWLAWTAIGGIFVGIILWAVFAGMIARAVPVNWQWPERMAARTLAMPIWEGGQRMMRTAAPDAFANIAAGDRIITANREAIERCTKVATKVRGPVQCTVRIGLKGKQ